MRLARDVAQSAPFKKAFSSWYFPANDVATMSDDQLLEAVRNSSETIYHPFCSNKMGPASDPNAVVDASLKVYGVQGLRVVDGTYKPCIHSSSHCTCDIG